MIHHNILFLLPPAVPKQFSWKVLIEVGDLDQPRLSLTQHHVTIPIGHWNNKRSIVSSLPQYLETLDPFQFLFLSCCAVWILSCQVIHKKIWTFKGTFDFQISIILTTTIPLKVIYLYMLLVVNFPEFSNFETTLSSSSFRLIPDSWMNLQTEGTSWLNIGLVGVCVFYRSWPNRVARPQKEGARIVFFLYVVWWSSRTKFC